MTIFLSIIVLLCLLGFAYLQHPKFGKLPTGERKKRVENSPNFRDGQFQNLHKTADLTEGTTYFNVIKKFLFEKNKRAEPGEPIPAIKTNLHDLDPGKNVLIWFGHSSYYLQIDGKTILVDPVFSGSASPMPFGTKAFKGTRIYSAEDIPEIDYLFISHDHWDHLDYETILKLKPKIKKVITGLGTGEHFETWGYKKEILIEKDWNEQINLGEGFIVHTVPARHFSGRSLKRNPVLWTSFVLQTPGTKIFIGGDSGYDTHFAEIGRKFGPFDLAILENGQYNTAWRYIHMLPEETLKAARDLQAKKLIPIHNSKFCLSLHAWDEPLKKITTLQKDQNLHILTPKIGEKVFINDDGQIFSEWFNN
ncbi:MAG TPA: MBL fold metallo-hydrolase [Salinimicrobium sp.]|nr:MBL fold metallo-hydrolase [Salinimicrobium sp.]